MKSYTDVKQSKILSKILPIESADMALCSKIQPLMTDYISAKKKFSNAGEIPIDPCWSLAALLDVLPANKLEKQFDGKWWFSVYLPSGQHKSHKHDNPIDACVEVILNLHKLNLL